MTSREPEAGGESTMVSTPLIAVTVVVAVLAVLAGLLSLFLYFRHKRTKVKLDEAQLLYASNQEHNTKEKKKSWRSKIITRKSIKFTSPTQGEIRTEAVQPDASQAGININQQLGFRQSQKSVVNKLCSFDEPDLGGVDVSQYKNLLNFNLEAADDCPAEPLGQNNGLGSILFALKYDFENQNLELRIVRCRNLIAKDVGGTSDPYVKAVITPGSKKYYLETKVKMRSLNPEWKETFYFEGFPLAKLENKSLVLQVLDFDRFSKDDPIGEVEVQLGDINFYEPNIFHRHLSPCTGDRRGLGELMVSLSHNQDTNQLTVIVVKARNLKAKDMNGLSDPYVKLFLLYQGQRLEKRKTTIRMRDLNPTFNESFVFNVQRARLKDSGVHLVVMDYDKWGKNELIGELILSSRSGTQEIKHWNETVYKQNQMITQWHALKKIKKRQVPLSVS